MYTIKDIAKEAGVSQGTVSNVLNGKGNVSSKKILLVQDAVKKLGYKTNEKAKILRKGKSNIIAIILPSLLDPKYLDFFVSFKNLVTSKGYVVNQYISNDTPSVEKKILEEVGTGMSVAVVTFTCLENAQEVYIKAGFSPDKVLFIERKPGINWYYLGFDYQQAGSDFASCLKTINKDSLTIVTGNIGMHESEFVDSLLNIFPKNTQIIKTDRYLNKIQIINSFNSKFPATIICTDIQLARVCRDIKKSFYPDSPCTIYSLSSIFTLPEQDFIKYEFNYRLLGHVAGQLINSIACDDCNEISIPKLFNEGFRFWDKNTYIKNQKSSKLKLLLLNSPPAFAVQHFSRMYKKETGIDIDVSVASYDDIYERISNMDSSSYYDIVRVGSDVLSWYAPRIFRPLDDINYDVSSIFSSHINNLEKYYSLVSGTKYAIPISPSLQVLFYRKDLFGSTVLKRLYQEKYHCVLAPPTTFSEYNQIAHFFTHKLNSSSPINRGSTITLGISDVVAGTEFMTRYFSYSNNLFKNNELQLLSPEAVTALEDVLALKKIVDTPSLWWTDAAEDFANGNSAMTILFSNFTTSILSGQSKVSENVGYSVVPGSNPLFGGGSLGVTKYSKSPEQALAFISWLCNEPVASGLALFGGTPFTKKTLQNYEIVDTYPWLELLSNCFSQSNCCRTPSLDNSPFDDRRFVALLGRAVKSCWFDLKKPKDALLLAQREYEKNVKNFNNIV